MASMDTPLQKAIDISGSQTALARSLGLRVQVVHNWIKRGSVPPRYAPGIEAATGVLAEDLCPDVPWHVIRGKAA